MLTSWIFLFLTQLNNNKIEFRFYVYKLIEIIIQTNWRERHEEFISAVSASKQVGNALKTGAPLPPPPKTASNAGKFNKTKNFKNKFKDYIKCDFCGRSFNKNAAERHIEFCKEQSVRKAILSKQGRQKTSESVKSRPKTRSSLTSSSATSSGSSHYGQSDKAVLTNSKSTHAPIQSSYANQRRPSGGSVIIHRNTESVERITASSNSRLPQPTVKRSNSAPRGKEISKPIGKSNSNTGKSTFSTPKSAGMSSTLQDNRLAKRLSKQHL
ncbi:unnamed protein product [Meloidogyne enterolobii]|uniref:Uncharacterized protein n=1 Tax=Meloidogyne enterolobii TaxID=390850 RepID=A0ACB0YF24_MELEN